MRLFFISVFILFCTNVCLASNDDSMNDMDVVIGDDNASIKIIEYSALSCPMCKEFYKKVYPDVIKKYISTEKVKLIIKPYALTSVDTAAMQALLCFPPEKRKTAMSMLFETQTSWSRDAKNVKDVLVHLMRLAGIENEKALKCLNDKKVEGLRHITLSTATRLRNFQYILLGS